MTSPVLLAVDGNSLTHRAYHALAGTGLRDGQGRPTWAVKGFWNLLLGAVDRVGPDAIVVGFDDHLASRRRGEYPDYKGQRPDKDEDLRTQLALIPQTLIDAGITVVVPPGLEADDVTAAAAGHAAAAGWDCVIVTSDRDAFAHIDQTTSVLRVINGGIENSPLLNRARFTTMTGIEPEQYLDYAAVRGDTSDNLPGIRGIGEKTAAKLLVAFGSMDAVWADVADGGERVVAAAGKAALTRLLADGAREAWARNRRIMAAAADVTLPVDLTSRGTAGHLPLDTPRLEAALAGVALRSVVGSAVSRLCAAPAPVADRSWLPPLEEPRDAADRDPGFTPDRDGYEPGYERVPAGFSDPGPEAAPEPAATRVDAGAATGRHPAALVETLF